MKKYLFFILAFLINHQAYAEMTWSIESVDDDKLIIAGELFTHQTICYDLRRNDRVVFIFGMPLACSYAEFINLRTGKKCKVYCE